ncbi:MAG TPA: hypothetical protein VEL31_20055, partial [Ktedonobacteraceae bacterium]|nr:hypothetical protein [Ktedonobacteraceae bacterium]
LVVNNEIGACLSNISLLPRLKFRRAYAKNGNKKENHDLRRTHSTTLGRNRRTREELAAAIDG